jgi:DNA-binding CsgD family transcriptional regulator
LTQRAIELGRSCEDARTPLLRREVWATPLTRRERGVVFLAANHTSRQIAERLGLSVNTVNNYLARAYAKLGIAGRAELRTLTGPP